MKFATSFSIFFCADSVAPSARLMAAVWSSVYWAFFDCVVALVIAAASVKARSSEITRVRTRILPLERRSVLRQEGVRGSMSVPHVNGSGEGEVDRVAS